MRRMTMFGMALFVCFTGCGGLDETPVDEGDGGELGQQESALWTGTTSEEFAPLNCDSASLINGFECLGSFCDNIRVNCTNAGVTHGSSYWTSQFSEETTNYRACGANEWVTGIACYGSYCDRLSLECTVIPGRTASGCIWTTGAISEEWGPWSAPAGHFVRGVRCHGEYCDNMTFPYCRLN